MFAEKQYGNSEVWPEIGKISGIANSRSFNSTDEADTADHGDVLLVCECKDADLVCAAANTTTEAAVLDPREDTTSETIKKFILGPTMRNLLESRRD